MLKRVTVFLLFLYVCVNQNCFAFTSTHKTISRPNNEIDSKIKSEVTKITQLITNAFYQNQPKALIDLMVTTPNENQKRQTEKLFLDISNYLKGKTLDVFYQNHINAKVTGTPTLTIPSETTENFNIVFRDTTDSPTIPTELSYYI